MTKVLVPLADGVEEMEAVILVDALRRVGWDVVTASVKEGGGAVCASRQVRLLPDAAWSEIEPGSFDLLAIPGGGPGTDVLRSDKRVLDAVCRFAADGKWVAAICAGPLVLQAAGILDGRTATSHPAVRDGLTGCRTSDERVVVDGRLVTSQGPGTAFELAVALVRLVDGAERADALAAELLLA